MAASNEWTEWLLTPQGWQQGSEHIDFGPDKIVERPPDCVLVVRYSEFVSSLFSKMDKGQTTLWRAKGQEEQIITLLAKHGDAPNSL